MPSESLHAHFIKYWLWAKEEAQGLFLSMLDIVQSSLLGKTNI